MPDGKLPKAHVMFQIHLTIVDRGFKEGKKIKSQERNYFSKDQCYLPIVLLMIKKK